MKLKELKNLANKIVKLELLINNCSNPEERKALELEMMSLCGKVRSIEDMEKLDDLVQELLSENS